MRPIVLVVGLVAGLQSVVAQSTSLFIPGFDPQPISADVVGVDAGGSTTWALQPGSVTADEDQSFEGTVTLVEGADGAQLTYADDALSLTLGYDCTFSSGVALCSGAADGTAFTETETVSSFAVALGTASAPASATNSDSSSQASSASSQASAKSGSGSSAAPSQTGSSKNSSTKETATSCVSLFGLVGLVLSLL